jgi:hyaluronate lyase
MPPASWSRRRFVLSAAAGFALAAPLAGMVVRPRAAAAGIEPAADEYATLRATWRDLILGTDFDPAAEPFATLLANLGTNARNHLARMAPAPGSLWPDAVYADPEPDTDQESYGYSARLNDSYNRLNLMAQAYSQPGTGVTGDAALRNAIIAGLDHLYADRYNERTVRYGNWWNWQIGSPQALTDICVLLHDHLSATQIANYCRAIDHFVPESVFDNYTGISTGANRVDLCRGVLLRGIVEQNPAKIELATAALAPVFPYVTTGDGFYADGSFIQHTRIPYIGGYGAVLHNGVGRILALLRGSRWELTDPNLRLFLDTVDDAIAPFIYNGLMMDNVSSRGISRSGTSEHTRAHGLLATIVLIGQGADAAENARWRAMVKGWMERDYYLPPLANPGLSLTSAALLSAVRDDESVRAAPEPVEHRLFHNMDRATHRRPGWAASISMVRAHGALRVRQRRACPRLPHRRGLAVVVGRRLRARTQLRRVLADRRSVPAAGHHGVEEAGS